MSLCGLFKPRPRKRRHRKSRRRRPRPPEHTNPSVRCNARCASVCKVHNRKAGDFLRQRPDASRGVGNDRRTQSRRRAASAPARRRSNSASARRRAVSTDSRDSSALYMSSPSERTPGPRARGIGRSGVHRMPEFSRLFRGGRGAQPLRSVSVKKSGGTSTDYYTVSSTTGGSRPSAVEARRKKGFVVRRPRSLEPLRPRFVVIDGHSVGRAMHPDRLFRGEAVQIALDHYAKKRIRAIAVLGKDEMRKMPGVRRRDSALLKRLEKEGKVTFTPRGTDYENFLIQYAMNYDVDILSNCWYANEVKRQTNREAMLNMKSFLNVHIIPFVFLDGKLVIHSDPKWLEKQVQHGRVKRNVSTPNKVRRARTI